MAGTARLALLFCAAVTLAGGCQYRPAAQEQSDAADHFLAGQLYVDNGNMELALEELSRAVQINPKMALAYSKMGEIYQTRGQLQDACRSYEKAVDLDPTSTRDFVRLGNVYQGLDRLADAVKAYVRAITLQPNDYQAQFELGTLYYRQGCLADAEQAFQKCIKIDPRRAEAFAHIGVVYHSQGRSYDACRAFRDSLERDIDQPKVLLNLANSYLAQGRYLPASDVLKLALKSNKTDPQVHQSLGACYYQLAAEAAQAARKADGDEQASLERCLKYLELSRASYRVALELDRNDPKTLGGLGAAEMLLARNTTDPARKQLLRNEAIECWHRSLELMPNQPEIAALLREYGSTSNATDMPRP